jgi:nucleoside-diphosphate-sugar epimerase
VKILVTVGAGCIGSAVISRFIENTQKRCLYQKVKLFIKNI